MLTRFVCFIVPTIDIHLPDSCQARTTKNVPFFEMVGYDTWMNDYNRLFLERKSVRAYEDRAIPESIKSNVRDAIRRAPTAGNLMLYSIIEVESLEIKERLSVTCDNQPFIRKTPWVLVFFADFGRMMEYYHAHEVPTWCVETGRLLVKPGESDLLLAGCDALIAAQTAVTACEYLGLGTCYIGDIMENWEIHADFETLLHSSDFVRTGYLPYFHTGAGIGIEMLVFRHLSQELQFLYIARFLNNPGIQLEVKASFRYRYKWRNKT